jgi:hypothetical protein
VDLDLILHCRPDASFEAASELCALVKPDRSEPSSDREPPASKKSVDKGEDTRCEERAKLDLEVFVL